MPSIAALVASLATAAPPVVRVLVVADPPDDRELADRVTGLLRGSGRYLPVAWERAGDLGSPDEVVSRCSLDVQCWQTVRERASVDLVVVADGRAGLRVIGEDVRTERDDDPLALVEALFFGRGTLRFAQSEGWARLDGRALDLARVREVKLAAGRHTIEIGQTGEDRISQFHDVVVLPDDDVLIPVVEPPTMTTSSRSQRRWLLPLGLAVVGTVGVAVAATAGGRAGPDTQ